MEPFSAEAQAEIQKVMDEIIAGQHQTSEKVRSLVAEFSVLPGIYDWNGFAGIRPDASFLSLTYEPPFELKPIQEARIQRQILFKISKEFPTLTQLLPPRPPQAKECPNCHGTGKISMLPKKNTIDTLKIGEKKISMEELKDGIICACGGLGWILKDEKILFAVAKKPWWKFWSS